MYEVGCKMINLETELTNKICDAKRKNSSLNCCIVGCVFCEVIIRCAMWNAWNELWCDKFRKKTDSMY